MAKHCLLTKQKTNRRRFASLAALRKTMIPLHVRSMQNFSEDHKELIQRVQRMRQDLAQWRERAEVHTVEYTDQLTDLQDELLQSMKEIKCDVEMMRSKVRAALDTHDPSWRIKLSETTRR